MKNLSDISTKSAFKNKICTLTESHTKGFFTDSDWSNVRKVITQITNNGGQVELLKTEYFGANEGKRFFYTVSNAFVSVQFVLVATFADKEANRYDICFYPIS
jgi:hypothetical protein